MPRGQITSSSARRALLHVYVPFRLIRRCYCDRYVTHGGEIARLSYTTSPPSRLFLILLLVVLVPPHPPPSIDSDSSRAKGSPLCKKGVHERARVRSIVQETFLSLFLPSPLLLLLAPLRNGRLHSLPETRGEEISLRYDLSPSRGLLPSSALFSFRLSLSLSVCLPPS